MGGPSPALLKLIAEGSIPKGRALIPGCGRGYDVYALAERERIAVGLELSSTAVEAAAACPTKPQCTAVENARIINQNFFDLDELEKWDFIYDYTFLCALDPSIRTQWASKMAALVKPGGMLLTIIFPITKKDGGPPFEMSLEIVQSLLVPVGFEKVELGLLPPELCHQGRGDGKEGPFNAISGIGRWIRTP